MPVFNNILAGAAGSGGAAAYQIDRSLRFNPSDTPWLFFDPSQHGNRKTFTFSFWVKRSGFGTQQLIHYVRSGPGNTGYIQFDTSDRLCVVSEIGSSNDCEKVTTQVFRDPSAWYHIVVKFDAANTNCDIYVNGEEVTAFDTNNEPSNVDSYFGGDFQHYLGAYDGSAVVDGYLAEVHMVNGQALDESDFGKLDDNNVWQPKEYSGTYGTNGFHLDFSDNSSKAALGTDSSGNSNTWTVNNLAATAPGLSTANQGFNVVTYTGNAGTQSIPVGFAPDFVWIKERNGTKHHALCDSVRGNGKLLYSALSNGEQDIGSSVVALTSTGFDLGYNSGFSVVSHNYNNVDHVAWCWKAGGTAVSNTYGSITSSVSANNTYGFSIVTYTGDGNNSKTVGHGLNSAPKMVFYKRRDASGNWKVYHESTGAGSLGELNSAGTISTNGDIGTAPTSSVIAVSSGVSTYLNDNNGTYVAYCWSEIPGFSKFGSFTHSSTTSLNLGFKPKFFLIKQTDGTTPWYLFDAERDSFDDPLFPNTAGAEANGFAFTANDTGISWISGSLNSGTYIYAAFADKPNGSIIDSLIETPTNYEAASGNNGGNYCTLNPLESALSGLNNGNLNSGSSGAASWKICTSTMAVSSGKYYWEGFTTQTATESAGWQFGFCQISPSSLTTPYGTGKWSYQDAVVYYQGSSSNVSTTAGANDLLAYALDMDAGTCKLYVNNSLVHTFTGVTGTITPFVGSYNSPTVTVNFGQRPFAYTPPTGFKSLCTTNLLDPLIADPSTVFDVVTRPGGGVTKTFTTLRPGFVWEKRRESQSSHYLFDVNRGNDKYLITNNTTTEGSSSGAFTFNTNSYAASTAFDWPSSATVVDWVWDGGSSNTPISAGSVSSALYNQTQTFSTGLVSSTGSYYSGDPATALFDGDISTSANPSTGNGSSLTFTPPSTLSYTSSVEIYTGGSGTHSFNGGTATSHSATTWTTIASGSGTISSIVVTGSNYPAWRAIRVDGKELVDSGVSITNVPSIASTVRANASAGFSIVKGNFSSVGDGTLAHGLNAAPTFYVIRNIDSSSGWYAYTTAVDGTLDYAFLNTTGAFSASSRSLPTSSVIQYQSIATGNHIAYCWAPVAGYSAFGSYEGNGDTSGNGPFVFTGMRPRWLLIKCSSHSGNWGIWDTARDSFNVAYRRLQPHESFGESGDDVNVYVDILSNGFRIKNADNDSNGSGRTYIYAAFAESPLKYARAR